MTIAKTPIMQNPFIRPAGISDDVRTAVVELQSALDLDSVWQSSLKLMRHTLPHRTCSLFFGIDDFEATAARHHVESPRNPDYMPATSLTVSGPYLARHRSVRLYTYSQILSEDPDARRRRVEQEPDLEWNEFVHLAFWRNESPEAVFSVTRAPEHPSLSSDERTFLESLHPMIEVSLRRVRAVEGQRARRLAYEDCLHRIPVATLLVAHDGSSLFATAEGEVLRERWNRGLRPCAGQKPELPHDLVRRFCRSGQAAAGKALRLAHPHIRGLSATIEHCTRTTAPGERPCYIITLKQDSEDDGCATASAQKLPEASPALQKLSPTERRVALLVAKGLRNDEIAESLCSSRRTVEFQLNSIYRKLELNRRTQLARMLN